MTGKVHTVRLSASSVFYIMQQRLYSSLAAQDEEWGERGRERAISEKMVLWKLAQISEVVQRKRKARASINVFQLPTHTLAKLAFWSLPVMLFSFLHSPLQSVCSGDIPVAVLQAAAAR